MAPQTKRSSSGKRIYENLAKKAETGDFSDLIDPLDYIILSALPDEGTMFGGVYPEGRTALNVLREKFGSQEKEGVLDVAKVAYRLRLLKELRLAMQVKSLTGAKNSWQKTKKGKEVVSEWQHRQEQKK